MTKKRGVTDEFDLGDSAEGRFDNWLREEGLVASPPRKDKGGWDFYVDLPASPGVPADPVPVKVNCSVQVKGQYLTTKQAPSIKLSNWKRMVEEPTPWFIFVLLYRGRRPVRPALIHIDKKWIDCVMERVWRNRAGKKVDLHRLSIRANWTADEELRAVHDGTGKDIIDAIRKHIGDPAVYVKRKMELLRNAGLGDVKHRVTLRTRDDQVDFEKLVEIALGGAQDIPVVDTVTSDIRFGIPIPRDTEKAGTISFHPRPLRERAKATFVTLTPVREPFAMELDIYSSASVFPFLPEEYRRVRLVAPLLHCDITPGRGSGSTKYEWQMHIAETPVRFDLLVQAARALRAITQCDAPICELEILGRTVTLPAGTTGKLDADPSALAVIDAVSHADYVARVFGLRLDALMVSPHQLRTEGERLDLLAGLFQGTTPASTLTMQGLSPDIDGAKVGYAMITGARIGDRVLLACLALVGEATWGADDGGHITVTPSIRVTERCVVSQEEAERDDFRQRIQLPMILRTENALRKEGLRVIAGDGR